MEAVDPRIHPALVPAGSRPVLKAKDQPQYPTLPSIHTPSGVVLTRWTLTDAERAAVLRGEDVYIGVCTFNQPLQPLMVSVGPCDWSEV